MFVSLEHQFSNLQERWLNLHFTVYIDITNLSFVLTDAHTKQSKCIFTTKALVYFSPNFTRYRAIYSVSA